MWTIFIHFQRFVLHRWNSSCSSATFVTETLPSLTTITSLHLPLCVCSFIFIITVVSVTFVYFSLLQETPLKLTDHTETHAPTHMQHTDTGDTQPVVLKIHRDTHNLFSFFPLSLCLCVWVVKKWDFTQVDFALCRVLFVCINQIWKLKREEANKLSSLSLLIYDEKKPPTSDQWIKSTHRKRKNNRRIYSPSLSLLFTFDIGKWNGHRIKVYVHFHYVI